MLSRFSSRTDRLLWISLFGAIACLVAFAWAAINETTRQRGGSSESSVRFEPVQLNLGALDGKKEKTFSLLLRNSKSSVVDIRDLTSTCGCTSVACDRKQIRSGETAKITGTLSAPLKAGSIRVGIVAQYFEGGVVRSAGALVLAEVAL